MSRRNDEGQEPENLGKCKVIKETNLALGVRKEDDEEGAPLFWVPKSVLHSDSEVTEQDAEGELVVKRWWAEKNA